MKRSEIIFYAIQSVLTVVGGYIGILTKGNEIFLYILSLVVVLDYISGIIRAGKEKKLSSGVGSAGIFKKIIIFLLVAVATMLDIWLLGVGSVLRTATVFSYLVSEGVSLLDNAFFIGFPAPKSFKNVMAELHNRKEL